MGSAHARLDERVTRATVIIGYRDAGSEERRVSLHHVLNHLHGRYQGVLADSTTDVFSRAGAFNQGASIADADVLVLHNPDVVIPHAQLDAAIRLAAASGVTVYPFTRYEELTEAATRSYLAGESADEYQLVMGEECVGPVLCIASVAYHQLGGMDERFRGWGYEDVAWDVSSRTLLGRSQRVWGGCTHLWHPPAAHSTAAPTVLTEANQALCVRYIESDGDEGAIRGLLAERDALRV